MKLTKSVALLLIITLLLLMPLSAMATEEEFIVHDLELNERIDALFRLRTQMETNYDDNYLEIQRIDQELQELGVETIRYEELLCKLGCEALPAVEVGSTSTTSWTSRRVVVTYRGQHYELQIVEGVPTSGDSPLRSNNVYVSHEAAGFAAGTMNLLDVTLETAVGFVPGVGDAMSLFSATVDAVRGYYEAYSEMTEIEHAEATSLVSLTTHMKLIWVKGYGSGDSYQVLCYMGNAVAYKISSITAVDILVEGVLHTEHVTETYDGETTYSEYYDDYSVSTKNYYAYRNNSMADYFIDYPTYYLWIETLGQMSSVEVPIELPAI